MASHGTHVLLAPVGAGKTETALDALLDTVRERPFASVWGLLPTTRQVHAFRERLVARAPERRAFFNIKLFDFYSLYSTILDAEGQPQRCLDEPARVRLLRDLLGTLRDDGQLRLFGEIAQTPGFVRVVAEFIYELKQNLIFPEIYANAAITDKDRELALIYTAYQNALREHKLVDREGEGWLATEAVQSNPRFGANVDLLLVDGYDQFNPLQAWLLTLLAQRVGKALITLTTVPGREGTVGRRFDEAYRQLEAWHESIHQPLERVIATPGNDGRHPALRHLVDTLLLPSAETIPPDGAVQFLEAPDARQEAAAVLRRVKKLLLDGVRPDDILIAVRDWGRYANALTSAAQMYCLNPMLAMQYGEPLNENPAITALLDLLDLPGADFRRRNLMDVLRSPYFELSGLDGEWVALLDRVSRALMVTGGREEWLDAIRTAANTPVDPDDPTGDTVLSVPASKALEIALDNFFTRITPYPTASVASYIRWLETLIGDDPEIDPDDEPPEARHVVSLNVIGRIRKPLPGVVERDLAAMERFKGVLRAFLSTQELFASIGKEDIVAWSAFLIDLRTAIAREAVQRTPARGGRVLVTTVADARGLPHKHVFVVGLSEGVFPAQIPEDPLYLDTERERLRGNGVPLPLQAERADDDGLFFELCSLARETLTLSRPYVQNGEFWSPSHLWRAALRVFRDVPVERIPLASVVPSDEAASLQEAALAVADGFNHAETDVHEPTIRAYNWLISQHGEYWRRVRDGRAVEASRLSRSHPYDRYTGRLSHPDLIKHAARALGDWKVWSASQLNDYGICAYRYYAGRMLDLEAMAEPEDGMSNLHAGTINHEILEETYRRFQKLNLPIGADTQERAITILREVAKDKLRDAPKRHGFHPSALWEQEKAVIERRLEALVRDDFSGGSVLDKYADGEARVPYFIEQWFGSENGTFTLHISETEFLKVRGKIDRIDRAGTRAIVVDYKTGRTKIDVRELARGRNFQMMLYVLAAQRVIEQEGSGLSVDTGVFWHIGSRESVGDLTLDDGGNEAIEAARGRLHAYLTRGRQGDFASVANKMDDGKCAHFCEFHTLCRVSNTARRKPED